MTDSEIIKILSEAWEVHEMKRERKKLCGEEEE